MGGLGTQDGIDEDHYKDLTTKVQKCIAYAVEHFRFALLLKVDTDSFVFMDPWPLPAQLPYLRALNTSSAQFVRRNAVEKWK